MLTKQRQFLESCNSHRRLGLSAFWAGLRIMSVLCGSAFREVWLTKNDLGAEPYQLISEERILGELCNQFFELLTSHIFLFLA